MGVYRLVISNFANVRCIFILRNFLPFKFALDAEILELLEIRMNVFGSKLTCGLGVVKGLSKSEKI